jgi:Mrp family chromosome partitioning ATPase
MLKFVFSHYPNIHSKFLEALLQNSQQFDEQLEKVELERTLSRIKHKILVMSGKGGVGKSTIAANLATLLSLSGHKTGLIDIDFHGPSIPKLMGLEGKAIELDKQNKIIPLGFGDHLLVMSLGLLLKGADDAVIWRGPMKMGAIKQLVKDVKWGDLDFMILDSPPGTGDEPLSVVQTIDKLDGAIIVTTPQEISISDVRRSVRFCEKLNLPVLGVVENMSGFVCPHCGKTVDIFKTGGGESMASEMNVPFLGRIPLEKDIVEASDEGKPFVYFYGKSQSARAFEEITDRLLQNIKPQSTDKEQDLPDSSPSE